MVKARLAGSLPLACAHLVQLAGVILSFFHLLHRIRLATSKASGPLTEGEASVRVEVKMIMAN
jgi:hypothetical protein